MSATPNVGNKPQVTKSDVTQQAVRNTIGSSVVKRVTEALKKATEAGKEERI